MTNIKLINNGDELLKYFIENARCPKCKTDYPREMNYCPFCEHIYAEVLDETKYEKLH